MEEKEIHSELASIRNLMERSSKFISLSGMSGILAGIYALAGSLIAYNIIYLNGRFFGARGYVVNDIPEHPETLVNLMGIAAVVLVLSVLTGVLLSLRKARKKSQTFWGVASKAVLFNMCVPLIAGGLLIVIFILRGYYGIVSPASLIFYGLALVSASNYTFGDVKYLGLFEIVLGLIAAMLPGYGLLFWALGFGVLHIIYGSIMYFKYDR